MNIRRNEDVRAYNEAAVGVAQVLGVEIDDLYAVSMQSSMDVAQMDVRCPGAPVQANSKLCARPSDGPLGFL